MKKSLLLLFALFSFSVVFAQADKQNMKVVTNTEPAFPKGDNALYSYVMMNLKYPEESKKKFVQGEVTLSFDVNTDSTVTNAIIISGVGSGVDEEVKKLIQGLKFSPAVQNGTLVKMNTMYTFPVKAH
ncbi:MAG: energy transducer TonB [Bacteroidia bacterium]